MYHKAYVIANQTFCQQDGFGTSCSFNYVAEDMFTRMFVLCMFLAGFCVPLLIIIVCYMLIFCSVSRHENMLRSQALITNNPHLRSGNQNIKLEMKVARVSTIVVILFCISWMPYAVVGLIGVSGNGSLITPLVSLIPVMFAKVSVVCNPLVYAVSMNRFKLQMEACFRCSCAHNLNDGTETPPFMYSLKERKITLMPSRENTFPKQYSRGLILEEL